MSRTLRDRLRGLGREPLVHFLVIGAVLFAGIGAVRDRRATVRIDARDLEQLASYWAAQTQRPPTRAELAAIIHERVDEELLAREAIRLGLDRDDMIVRRRLAQKMAFASQDVATIPEPSTAKLQAFYETTQDRYASPARLALRHIYFNQDRIGLDPQAAARDALTRLKAGQLVGGDPALLPLTYADVPVTDLARDYGPQFLKASQTATVGVWVGPVASPYGIHLIRVEKHIASAVPPLSAVRKEVRDAWMLEQRGRNNRAYLDRLRHRYRVEIADLPK